MASHLHNQQSRASSETLPMAPHSPCHISTIFLALSLLNITFALSPLHKKLLSPPLPLLSHPLPNNKATPADMINLLGSNAQASAVDPAIAKELRSCFHFLVPFAPTLLNVTPTEYSARRSLISDKEDELIWRPPQGVLDLARLALDSGGDRDAIQGTLDPQHLDIPDIQGAKKDKCELTRTPYGRRFISEELNSYFKFVFEFIVARSALFYDLKISFSRYDLFHGHLFLAQGSNRLGILFHAKEYPAFDARVFPQHMGPCQTGSDVRYEENSMNLRNFLWLAPMPSSKTKDWDAPGVLVLLDARPDGIIYKDIIPDYAHQARTVYDDMLGKVVFDVNYLDSGTAGNNPIYICG